MFLEDIFICFFHLFQYSSTHSGQIDRISIVLQIPNNKYQTKKPQNDRPTNFKWIEVPQSFKLEVPFIKATPLRPIGVDAMEYQAMTERGPIKLQVHNNASFLISKGQLFDDMCDMDILNEPQILSNLVERYKKNKIFTLIGPTLIVVNPYRVIPEYFSNETMMKIRNKILNGNGCNDTPHIYLIAGNAYTSMIDRKLKQAIVISGESGAGKTESTKYCMQILTSLSHQESLPIEGKILACNPILEAFGNSKTTRNDNSSRFGKYVQIYFGTDHKIAGASINSYLLEKSRVVSAAEGQRSFHIFYCLLASRTVGENKAESYKYLSKSKCFEATGIDDKKYFSDINKSMDNIGFTEQEKQKIWDLLGSILQLGNIQFDDTAHQQHESKACEIVNKKQLQSIANKLNISEPNFEKILLYEKKKFLKEFTFSPYTKNKCLANVNTLSKAIYNAIFQFILMKIQKSLAPSKSQDYLSINILDIFGFENFDVNSFEQFCINFTNEKLLKLYNKYVFQKEMQILKQDGLLDQIENISPPTNDAIINIVSGKLSLFSIINDFTMPQQFKDLDIIQGFQSKLSKSAFLKFQKIHKSKFTIVHSQCCVKYEIEGFKQKNQDKVIPEISSIVDNLFEHQSKEQSGKTLLNKFYAEIDELMNELNSSSAHFIRCIKPNQKKIPNFTEQKFLITQIRYLGVFQTIQIRKKTFPSRWIYKDFIQRFSNLFKQSNGSDKEKTEKIMKELSKNSCDYLLGDQRVYMNLQLENTLSKKLHEQLKKKMESCQKIWKCFKKYKFRKEIGINLKVLISRIRKWRKFEFEERIKIERMSFDKLKLAAEAKKQEEQALRNKKLIDSKIKREQQQKAQKQQKISKRKDTLIKYIPIFDEKRSKLLKTCAFQVVKQFSINKTNSKMAKKPQITKIEAENVQSSKDFDSTNSLDNSLMNESIVIDEGQVYKRQICENSQIKKQSQFNQSFVNEKSMVLTNDQNIIFEGTFQIKPFNKNEAPQLLERLRLILTEKYEPKEEKGVDDSFSPSSDDGLFEIEETREQILQQILNFPYKQFFKRVLRRRTNFIGMQKNEQDILVHKSKPLTKSMTMINEKDEQDAIKLFKIILKIGAQSKLQNVFKFIQLLIRQCHGTSPELKNQFFIQLIRQANIDVELTSVRVMQTLVVFLHIFNPDRDFLLSGLRFFFDKLSEQRFSEKQNQYMRYAFRKVLRKIQRQSTTVYMPIRYQMMALMCRRKITVPVYLAIGNSALLRVESHETIGDIKLRAMQQLGLNSKRLLPEMFSFFEIANYDNQQLEQNPINEKTIVWDTVSYWQKAKDTYKQKGFPPPVFFLMFKIKYVFECHFDDQQTIQLMFGQAYYEYFTGRIRLDLNDLGFLSGVIKLLKFSDKPKDEFKCCYSTWAHKAFQDGQLIEAMNKGIEMIVSKGWSDLQIKYKFISVSSKSPLSISFVISNDQNDVRFAFKSKSIVITNIKFDVKEQIPIKSLINFKDDGQTFFFEVVNSAGKRMISTEHASILSDYLLNLPKIMSKIKDNNNKFQISQFIGNE